MPIAVVLAVLGLCLCATSLPALEVRLVAPRYRSTIYATQRLPRIKAVAMTSLPRPRSYRLQCALCQGDQVVGEVSTVSVKGRETPFALPARDLPVGDYALRVSLRDADDREVASASHPLRRLGAHHGEVRVDDSQALLVDGKPFLPNGYMGIGLEHMAAAQAEGCNVLHNYGSPNWSPQQLWEFLDRAWEHRLKVVIYPWGQKADVFGNGKHLTDQERQRLVARVAAARDHPALLAWYMCDEPEINGQTPARMREAYDLVRETDPWHPCLMLNNTFNGIGRYRGTADIVMPDPCPRFTAGHGWATPITMISRYQDRVHAACGPHVPAWATLQAFNYGDFSDGKPYEHGPTFAQFRAMVWLAVIYGCKGFIHYAYPYARREPELRLGIPYLTRELNLLSPAVLSSRQRRLTVLAGGPALHAVARVAAGRVYVLAVNTSGRAVDACLQVEGLGERSLHVVGEGRTVACRGGTLTDRFARSAVHLYTDARINSLPLSEAQQRIAALEAARVKPGNLAVWLANRVRATASSYFHSGIYDNPRMAINGLVDEDGHEGWMDKTPDEFPDWLCLTWEQPQTIGRVEILGTTLRDYEVQWWDGTGWAAAAKGAGNERKVVSHSFPPVRTDRLRLWVTAANGPNAVVSEIECYAQ